MSAGEIRYPAAKALEVAIDVMQKLNDRCNRIVMAGSLRRKKPAVGDVEILYVPRMGERPKDMFTTEPYSLAEERIAELLKSGFLTKRQNKAGNFTWGEQNKLAIHAASGMPVDLFGTIEKNWWVSLVVRTGSLETNMRLTTGAQKLGKSLNAYGCGVTNEDGSVTPAVSERHVFELCGVEYLEPQQR